MAGVVRADAFHMGGIRNPTAGVWTGRCEPCVVIVSGSSNTADRTGYGSVDYV
jgi:hypothetical protein